MKVLQILLHKLEFVKVIEVSFKLFLSYEAIKVFINEDYQLKDFWLVELVNLILGTLE